MLVSNKGEEVPRRNLGDFSVSFKHIERAKQLQGVGYVFSTTFREVPKVIKEVEGRKILYQSPVGIFSNRDYRYVYFIPKKEVAKLKKVNLSDGKFYEIVSNLQSDREEKPHYFKSLASKGLHLKEINL